MVIISEIPDDGSNGDDPTKEPEEEEKKPKEDEEKPKQVITQKNRSFFFAIPDGITETCVALVRRCHYPKISLVSRYFHGRITSPELYEARLRLNITECVLYGLVGFLPPFDFPSWYILHRNQVNSLRLRIIDSLSPMPFGSAVVTIGPEMYVIGGFDGHRKRTSRVILIDCRFQKWRLLPNMRRVRYRAAAGVIDGKIYVIGGRDKRYLDWVEVFDVKTRIWSSVPGPYPVGTQRGEFETYVVMEEKIYVLDLHSCFSYEPKTRKWESYNRLRDLWQTSCCVVDDMLYTIDPLRLLGSSVIVYDPKEKNWGAVNGVGALPNFFYYDSKMANFGGKLVILGASQSPFCEKNIWCVEIALERCEEGEIWGKIESAAVVFTSLNLPSIELCRTVTV